MNASNNVYLLVCIGLGGDELKAVGSVDLADLPETSATLALYDETQRDRDFLSDARRLTGFPFEGGMSDGVVMDGAGGHLYECDASRVAEALQLDLKSIRGTAASLMSAGIDFVRRLKEPGMAPFSFVLWVD